MEIRIGSRESRLAVIQSEMVQNWLKSRMPEVEVSILTMKTTGDIILDRPLAQVGGKRIVCQGAGPGVDGWKDGPFRSQPERSTDGSSGRTACRGVFRKGG